MKAWIFIAQIDLPLHHIFARLIGFFSTSVPDALLNNTTEIQWESNLQR